MGSEAQKAALDDALRAEMADMLDEGEVITCWVAIAGVRRINGGGSVLTTSSGRTEADGPATWEIEGLLRRGLAILNAPEDD